MKITNFLNKTEIKYFTETSDLRGLQALICTWGIIIGSMLLVAFKPNFFTIFVALILIGGRQLALAILCHDASHYSLFNKKRLNDTIGQWFCAYPVGMDLFRYRKHHLKHHLYTGTKKDPDLALVEPYPVNRKSMFRKFIRDITGITGLRRLLGIILIDLGFIEYTVSGTINWTGIQRKPFARIWLGIQNLKGVFLTNGFLLYISILLKHQELFLLWILSYLTTFSVFLRIRSIAEHACTEKSANPLRNTRTTIANPLARLTVAPHFVNYHLEHHLLMTVPNYKLPQLHKTLKEKGAYEEVFLAPNYSQVLSQAISTRD